MPVKAVIFDLDGVIVSTDNYHYLAWKNLADKMNIYFDEKINNRLRGVSRMQSLDILLEKASREFSENEKMHLAFEKNEHYKELLKNLSPNDILDGVMDFCTSLKNHKIKLAIGSSSKNARTILKYIGLDNYFDVVIDGNDISKSKPDPEVFTKAAKSLEIAPCNCVVIEDAYAGVEAALSADMKVVGVGDAQSDRRAHLNAEGIKQLEHKSILGL
jgi:beta-phosphoglucomutase